jgi:Mn-dependent DtxR family transcriptional regulator
MTDATPYLLALYTADRDGRTPIAPGDVADAVGRSPAAATEMLQRLEADGLVDREPYRGATLTPEGRQVAEGRYRTYAILSRFFREVLDLADHEAEAIRVAGSVSPVVAERLASVLLPGVADRTDGGPLPPLLPTDD